MPKKVVKTTYKCSFTSLNGRITLTGEFTKDEIIERINHWLKDYSSFTIYTGEVE